MMATEISVSGSGELIVGTTRELFTLPDDTGSWLPADDGRFLVNVLVRPSEVLPMTVLVNWPALLAAK